MDKFIETVLVVLGFILLIVILGAFTGYFVMLLWNWLLVDLFAFPVITWLQGWGLTVLCSLLFKSTNTSSNKK